MEIPTGLLAAQYAHQPHQPRRTDPEFQNVAAQLQLERETPIAEPSSDCSSVDAARAALEPALHAWEESSELNQGLRFSFKYAGSAVHDVASSQQRAVAIDDVVALSDAVAAVRCRDGQLLGARRQGKAGTPRRVDNRLV